MCSFITISHHLNIHLYNNLLIIQNNHQESLLYNYSDYTKHNHCHSCPKKFSTQNILFEDFRYFSKKKTILSSKKYWPMSIIFTHQCKNVSQINARLSNVSKRILTYEYFWLAPKLALEPMYLYFT